MPLWQCATPRSGLPTLLWSLSRESACVRRSGSTGRGGGSMCMGVITAPSSPKLPNKERTNRCSPPLQSHLWDHQPHPSTPVLPRTQAPPACAVTLPSDAARLPNARGGTRLSPACPSLRPPGAAAFALIVRLTELHPNACLSFFIRLIRVLYFNVFFTRMMRLYARTGRFVQAHAYGDRQRGAPLAHTHSAWPCQQLLRTCHSPVAR